MILLALRNLWRRPLRHVLALIGIAVSVATLACLGAFGQGYRAALQSELDGMGMQMMLVPLGCPYDAAARVLKGKTLEFSLPQSALLTARRDPAVSLAAPMLMAVVPHVREGRTDVWVGIDQSTRQMKPWWKVETGAPWFTGQNEVILGAEAAELEMRRPGDLFYSPETHRTLRVAGILQRSGTADDSLFFVPLTTAQAMFHQPQRITAIAVQLHDPQQTGAASARLQTIAGAQVVTLSEMMGTFLNLVGAVKTLLFSLAVVALAIGALGVFNTLLSIVVERRSELAMMRALGASGPQIFALLTLESARLTLGGGVCGLIMSAFVGRTFASMVRQWVPLSPNEVLFKLTPDVAANCFFIGLGVGVLAGVVPAWQASRLPPALALNAD